MNYWNIAAQHLVDNFIGAFVGGLVFTILSCFFWRAIYNWVQRKFPDGKSGLAKIVESAKIPGYLIFVLLGVRIFMALSPAFQSKDSWAIAADLSASFLAVIMIGEGIFAFFIDFYLLEHRKAEVPSIFKQLIKAITYLIVGLSFLSTTYKIDITPLLTTSAVFTMVLGLALQDVLGNLFSGISVHISPPFKLGDWIKVAGYFGKVIESNWRATTLSTPVKDLVVLPNNDIAKKEIVNLGFQEGVYMQELPVGISYNASPERVRQTLLSACQQVATIAKSPKSIIYIESFGDSAINYRVRFYVPEGLSPIPVRDQLASRIWYRLKREGISIPYPIREIYTHPEKDDHDQIISHRLALIAEIDFLKQIARNHQVYVAEHLQELWYEPGEIIVQKGSESAEFYIIDQGRVAVFLDDTSASPVAHLKEGDFFGEMSLLTGEPRSATIRTEAETRLLMMNQDTVRHILEETPDLAKLLSDVLAERSARNLAQKQDLSNDAIGVSSEKIPTAEEIKNSSIIFERIKRFFRMR